MLPLFLIIFGIAFAAGRGTKQIVANASMQGEEPAAHVMPPGQYDEKKKIQAAIASGNPRAMVRLADKIGGQYPKTAEILLQRAIIADQKIEKEKRIAIPSPIAGIVPVAWGRYVRVMAKSRPGNGRVGMFGLSMRRLADIGLISKIENDIVEWVEGVTPEDFEQDTNLQYRAFAKSSRDHAKSIKQGEDVGKMICGEEATLSGLMAVAHFAGMPSYHKWVENEKDREKFPATTQAYQAVNGLF